MIQSNKKLLLSAFLSLFSTMPLAATGELWDVKVKMDGMGDISMPATQVCMPKDKITEKNVQQGDDCRTTNFKSLGARHVKFNFSCKDGTTGDADIQGDSKSFKQTMNMVDKGEKTTINSEGKNTGKACDPDAGKKEMEANMAKVCEDAAKDFQGVNTFYPDKANDTSATCAKFKGAYCGVVKSTAREMDGNAKVFKDKAFGHNADANTAELLGTWKKAVKVCNAGNADSIAKNAYGDAIKTSNWEAARYINKSEVDAIYARECVGRNYTSRKIKSEYSGLCNGVSESASESSGSNSGSTKTGTVDSTNNKPASGTGLPTGDDVMNKAKKLKDLFDF